MMSSSGLVMWLIQNIHAMKIAQKGATSRKAREALANIFDMAADGYSSAPCDLRDSVMEVAGVQMPIGHEGRLAHFL